MPARLLILFAPWSSRCTIDQVDGGYALVERVDGGFTPVAQRCLPPTAGEGDPIPCARLLSPCGWVARSQSAGSLPAINPEPSPQRSQR